MTHLDTSKTRSKTPVEFLLGRRVRQPAIADFDLCEPILFKANEKTKTVPVTFIIRKGVKEPSRTSTRNRKQPDRFGEPIPTKLLKKGGRM